MSEEKEVVREPTKLLRVEFPPNLERDLKSIGKAIFDGRLVLDRFDEFVPAKRSDAVKACVDFGVWGRWDIMRPKSLGEAYGLRPHK